MSARRVTKEPHNTLVNELKDHPISDLMMISIPDDQEAVNFCNDLYNALVDAGAKMKIGPRCLNAVSVSGTMIPGVSVYPPSSVESGLLKEAFKRAELPPLLDSPSPVFMGLQIIVGAHPPPFGKGR